jgi:putative transposase
MVSISSLQVFKDRSSSSFLFEKSIIIERTIQYIKDSTEEGFDDYFPCRKKKCKLKQVKNWLNLFVDYHNKELKD